MHSATLPHSFLCMNLNRVDPEIAARVERARTPDEVRDATDGIEDEELRLRLIAFKAPCFDQAMIDELVMSDAAPYLCSNPAFQEPRWVREVADWFCLSLRSETAGASRNESCMSTLFRRGLLTSDSPHATMLWSIFYDHAPRRERRDSRIANVLAHLPDLSEEEILRLAERVHADGFKWLCASPHASPSLWQAYLRQDNYDLVAINEALRTPSLLGVMEVRRGLLRQKAVRSSAEKLETLCRYAVEPEEFREVWGHLACKSPRQALKALDEATPYQLRQIQAVDLAPLLADADPQIRLQAITRVGQAEGVSPAAPGEARAR